jgi:Tol biopolymer transport system component
MKLRTLGLISVLTGGLVTGASAPVQAAFPGANGRIVFSTDFTRPSQIYSAKPNGADVRQLTQFDTGHGAAFPNVSPDGALILFNHLDQIWVMNADGSDQHALTHGAEAENLQPSWAPDGTKVIFARCTSPFGARRCSIDVMNADGSGITKLLGGDWVNQFPEYSPDGETIAFVSNRGGYVSNIWVMDSEGQGLKRLTPPVLQAWAPDWSPDGTHIVFTSDLELPFSSVWVMRSDGTDLKELTHPTGGHQAFMARYSPDGTKIALVSDLASLEHWELYVMRADGSHMHAIVTNQPTMFFIDWGPAETP